MPPGVGSTTTGLPQTRRAPPALRRTGLVVDFLVSKSKQPRSGGPFPFKETAPKGAIRRIRILMRSRSANAPKRSGRFYRRVPVELGLHQSGGCRHRCRRLYRLVGGCRHLCRRLYRLVGPDVTLREHRGCAPSSSHIKQSSGIFSRESMIP